MSTDYWKNGGMRAIAFNDAALLTCLSNDCGYENVFGKSVEMFADEGDILVAISSSGKSENILNGVHAARKMGAHVVTLSGFKSDNQYQVITGNDRFKIIYDLSFQILVDKSVVDKIDLKKLLIRIMMNVSLLDYSRPVFTEKELRLHIWIEVCGNKIFLGVFFSQQGHQPQFIAQT